MRATVRLAFRRWIKPAAREGGTQKLARYDALSSQGPWTQKVFALIREHPRRRAADLAEMAGWETRWMKLNVRKLKALGLTVSHEVGYELSPRGRELLARLKH